MRELLWWGVCIAGVPWLLGSCSLRSLDSYEQDPVPNPMATTAPVCGANCPPAHAQGHCNNGECEFTCLEGFEDCDGNPENGCEQNLLSDSTSCGACDNACSADGLSWCDQGTCRVCDSGLGNCDGQAANGCETDLNADPNACGSCQVTCPVPANAVAVCEHGSCGSKCADGFMDCDGQAQTGCETSIVGNPEACGACDHTCPDGFSCSGTSCICDSHSDCDLGFGGKCLGNRCSCGSAGRCEAGQRCVAANTCG